MSNNDALREAAEQLLSHADWKIGASLVDTGYLSVLRDALAASKPEPQAQAGEPSGCACRWDKDDNRVQTCERHQGWLDVVHELAERAKAAEEAIDKKDSALKACVREMQRVSDERYRVTHPTEFEEAITQAQKALE